MNNFKKDGFRKGGSDFGGKPRFGGGKKFGGPGRGHDRGHGRDEGRGGDKELFKTTCTACKKACEVPFRPSSDKPVYCRECFAEKGPNDNRVSSRSDSRGEFRRDARPQRDERPVRNEYSSAPREAGNDELKRQIANLESKVTRILEILSTQPKAEVPSVVSTKKEPEVVAPKKARKPKTEKIKVTTKKNVAKKKSK